jgi:hypothetical protein
MKDLLVALEAGTGSEPPIEVEYQLLDIVAFGPGGCQPVNTFAVAAVQDEHIRNPVAHLVERSPYVRSEGLGLVGAGKGGSPTGEYNCSALRTMGIPAPLSPRAQEIAGLNNRRGHFRRCPRRRLVWLRARHRDCGE